MTRAHDSVFPFTALLTRGSEATHDVNVGGDVRAGMARKGHGLVMRYTDDKLASERHIGALKDAFDDHLETVEFDGNDHSLLTLDFHEPAYQRVQVYFRARFARAE